MGALRTSRPGLGQGLPPGAGRYGELLLLKQLAGGSNIWSGSRVVAWPGALYIAQTRVRIGMVTLSKDEGLPHDGGAQPRTMYFVRRTYEGGRPEAQIRAILFR